MKHRVVTIGRGTEADIRLADDSISRLHAELVVSAGGLLHVADRSSTNGTWIRSRGRWERVRQRMVEPLDRLRLGELEVPVFELVRRIPDSIELPRTSRPEATPARAQPQSSADDGLPRGRVRRNPLTGEVMPS